MVVVVPSGKGMLAVVGVEDGSGPLVVIYIWEAVLWVGGWVVVEGAGAPLKTLAFDPGLPSRKILRIRPIKMIEPFCIFTVYFWPGFFFYPYEGRNAVC